MTGLTKLEAFTLPLTIGNTHVDVAGMFRQGNGLPLVFLHGFGSTKEDYADVIQQPELAGRTVLAYDAPGCGATTCSGLDAISVPFLVSVAKEVLSAKGIDRFHLVGHSMGGLTALLLADQEPSRVVSFIDIEGNVAPEDCFLSRQIISHAHPDPDGFFHDFQERVWSSRYYSSALYAASLPHKVRAGAVRPIFESMVELSDNANLLERFLALPFPRMYMYGIQNNTLSYLPLLKDKGVELAEISQSGHFPMYSNAPEMWSRLTAFVSRSEQA
ncbi:alpha/beta fold hydrolase [Paenarthrobacter sp. NPDC089675]|uniref:alpha/beta fold hydrolase n=1 Tax=Paenarthrobacter sp. NPDC089675 TaxID=3364376 RepID=UPI003810F796